MNQTIGQRRTLQGFNHRPRRNVRRRRRTAREARAGTSMATAAARRFFENGWTIAIAFGAACAWLCVRAAGYCP